MKKKLLLAFIALTSIINTMAITIVPTTSTSGNDVWYYIKCNPRNPNAPLDTWISVSSDDTLRYKAYTGGDEQLWKVVENGTGIALVNKLKGNYLNVDAAMDRHNILSKSAKLSTTATLPTNALRLVVSSGYTYATPWTGWDGTNGIFIVDNTVTQVDASNKITFNTTQGTRSFCLTSMGTGYDFALWSLYGWPGGNINQVVVFRTQEEIIAEIKVTLLTTITTVNTAYTNSTEGSNPGQVSADDRIALKDAIDAAQAVYDDTNSTIQNYQDAVVELNSLYSMFKTQINTPKISSDGSEEWYLLKRVSAPASTTPYMTSTGAGAVLKCQALTMNDDQLWKLVQNDANDGWLFVNKATGEYINSDIVTGTAGAGTDLLTSTTKPAKGLKFRMSTVIEKNTACFFVENSVGTTVDFRLRPATNVQNNTKDNDLNCNWLFISSAAAYQDEFRVAKIVARTLHTASVEGEEFGQYKASVRSTFNDLIALEEAKDTETMSQDDLKAATKTLNDAIAAYNCNGDVTTLSSITKIKWFRLINAMQPPTGYASGKAMSSTGRTPDTSGYQGKYTFLTKNVNTDDQLFRFEMNADGTKATTLVNKGNGKYVGSNGAIVSTPTPDVEFEITRLDINSFWIKPTTAAPLHAAASNTEILNWNASAGSASAWKLEYVTSTDVDDFTAAYLTKRIQTRAKYDATLLISGDQIGQYTTATTSALGTLITAEEAKDAATLTQAQLLQGILDMNAAVAALAINTDIKLLVSTTPNTTKWFRLINGAAASVTYASGMVMSSNGRLKTEAFTFEAKDVNSDAQLFKFELNAAENKVAKMYNKAAGLYMSPTGTMLTNDSIVQITNEFEITQLAGGRSFWIHPTYMDATDPAAPYRVAPLHAAASGTMILNWNAGAGSASAWIFEFVKEETTAVKNVEAFTYRVRTTNNIITVDGVENFEVYSVLGQKQNTKKALNNGVYFVKVNNAVKKVILK